MSGCKCLVTLVVALVLTMGLAEAQSGTDNTCAQELTPCFDYINTNTTPPSSCCDPLKRTVANQLTCLCDLFNTPGLLSSFNITVEKALGLSRRCGVTTDISTCTKAQAPGSQPPPATPGREKGAAGRVTFTGLSFLLLFWVLSMQFN